MNYNVLLNQKTCSAKTLGLIYCNTGALIVVPAIEEWTLLEHKVTIAAVIEIVAVIRMRINVNSMPLALFPYGNV